MVKFGEYLQNSTIQRHADYYLKFDKLAVLRNFVAYFSSTYISLYKKLLDQSMKIDYLDAFYTQLEASHAKTKSYADEWLKREENNKEFTRETISGVLELNQFVFINQEALARIIKQHDEAVPGARLYPIWK